MSTGKRTCPPWAWWIRTGERLNLGLDLRLVFQAGPGENSGTPGVTDVLGGIRSGQGVVESMRGAGWRLPREAWCLLAAGEKTGRLGDSMREVGEFLHQRRQRRRELTGQLWYPGMVCFTGLLVMGLILFWVVPEMRTISESMGMDGRLPWLTEHIGLMYGLVFAVLCVSGGMVLFLVVLFRHASRASSRWAELEERTYRKLPFIGRLRAQTREARILRQLGMLLHGGVTLPEALDMIARGASGKWEHAQVMDFRRRLLMGAGFTEALRAFPLVDPENAPLLLAGQEAGCLESYMERIASELDSAVTWRIRQWIRFLEPATLVCLSAAIGGLILAYLLPMVRMFEQLA